MMKQLIERLFNHEALTQEEAQQLMLRIVQAELNPSQIASILTAYQMRTPTVDEIIGFRAALLETRVPVDFSPYKPIDIVGTGGDGKNTFNISTCACFVVAGAGYKVAKHGNYSATSVSGASNVMELHGVKFTNQQAALQRSIEESGVAYLHAPLFNPALKNVATVRKEMQVRTIFNLLGPLVNPSSPTYQLLGVANLSQVRLYANVLRRICAGYAVVSSLDQYDEISLTSGCKVTTTQYEAIFTPKELGFEPIAPEEIYGGKTPQEAALIFNNVLKGVGTSAQRNCVVANAAFAIQAIVPNQKLEECIASAQRSIESGKAYEALKRFISLNS